MRIWGTGRQVGVRLPFPVASLLNFAVVDVGNGWAAAGMLRVLGTIAHSQFAGKMKKQQIDLANWVQEIHDGMYDNLVRASSSYAPQTLLY